MRWQTRDPDDPRRIASYGHDPERGAWVELVDGGVNVAFDVAALGLDVGEDPMLAVLGVLTEFGFVADWQDVLDAVRWIEREERGSRGRRPPRRLRAAVRVLRNLREAAG